MDSGNNGTFSQFITQLLCWLTATYSYLQGLSVSDLGVIIGLGMSLIFGLYGAWQQRKRTKLQERQTRILEDKYGKGKK